MRNDLGALNTLDVVLFGSAAKGNATTRSDIDIAVLTHNTNHQKNMALWKKLLGSVPPQYDVKVFELLPLDIKMSIIRNYTVLWGEPLEISEYFYHFRKLWNDAEKRHTQNKILSAREKIRLLRRAARCGL